MDEAELDALLGALAEAPPVPLDPVGPGTVLGPYRVEAPLGRGGMGRVFRAVDQRLDRTVALKVLDQAGVGAAEALLREARAAVAVSDPALVTVYDVGQTPEGLAWIAMELVPGEPLSARAVAEPFEVARTIAGALAALHRGGLVHRDLKPSNVVRTSDGRLKLVDFGLAARTIDPEPPRGGTPSFLPPEARAGGDAGPAGDVYAFGVLLRWLGSGSVQGPAPRGLRELAERCTRSDPAERPADGAALVAALDRIARRRRLGGGLAGAAVLALVAVAVGVAWPERGVAPPPPSPRAELVEAPAEPPAEWERLTDLDGSAMLFEGVTSPDGTRLAYAERRGVFVRELATDEVTRIAGADLGAHCVAFAPDGSSLWIGGAEGVFRAPLGELLEETAPTKLVDGSGCPMPSPDGRWLAVERTDRVELIDRTAASEASEHSRVLIEGPGALVVTAFAPDSSRLAALRVHATAEGASTVELSVIDVEDESETPRVLHSDPAFWMPTKGLSLAWLDADSLLVGYDGSGTPDGERQLLRTPADEWAPEVYATLPFDPCRLSVDSRGRVSATSHAQEPELLVAALGADELERPERISRSLATLRPSGWSAGADAVLVVEESGDGYRALRYPTDDDALPEPVAEGPATWPMPAGGGVAWWRPPSAAGGSTALLWRDPEGATHEVLEVNEAPAGAVGWRRPPPTTHRAACDPDPGSGSRPPRCVILEVGESPRLRLVELPSGAPVAEWTPPAGALSRVAVRWSDPPLVALTQRSALAVATLAADSATTDASVRRLPLPEGCEGDSLTFDAAGESVLVAGWCQPPEPYRLMRVSLEGEVGELYRSAERWLGDPVADPSGERLALHGNTFRSNVWRLRADRPSGGR